jgi:hypothetical protein
VEFALPRFSPGGKGRDLSEPTILRLQALGGAHKAEVLDGPARTDGAAYCKGEDDHDRPNGPFHGIGGGWQARDLKVMDNVIMERIHKEAGIASII